ncbi:hypothetical protein F4782DRAFT_141562 [Xylaria castorea]|nr:hypothetical protein F4782DRAFT_141562 [Xylaria castorea]
MFPIRMFVFCPSSSSLEEPRTNSIMQKAGYASLASDNGNIVYLLFLGGASRRFRPKITGYLQLLCELTRLLTNRLTVRGHAVERLLHSMSWGFDGAMGNPLRRNTLLAEARYPASRNGGRRVLEVPRRTGTPCKVPRVGHCDQAVASTHPSPRWHLNPLACSRGEWAGLRWSHCISGKSTDPFRTRIACTSGVIYLRPNLNATGSMVRTGL